jgi:hypothetical protein
MVLMLPIIQARLHDVRLQLRGQRGLPIARLPSAPGPIGGSHVPRPTPPATLGDEAGRLPQGLLDGLELAALDFRDVLVRADLADDDWPAKLHASLDTE